MHIFYLLYKTFWSYMYNAKSVMSRENLHVRPLSTNVRSILVMFWHCVRTSLVCYHKHCSPGDSSSTVWWAGSVMIVKKHKFQLLAIKWLEAVCAQLKRQGLLCHASCRFEVTVCGYCSEVSVIQSLASLWCCSFDFENYIREVMTKCHVHFWWRHFTHSLVSDGRHHVMFASRPSMFFSKAAIKAVWEGRVRG